MSIEGPRPTAPEQHKIAKDAGICFMARCPSDWYPKELDGDVDYGYDYQVQTAPNQQVTDIFRVQLKGTKSPNFIEEDAFISMQVKARTVRYYANGVEPILFVVCDLTVAEDPVDCPLYYVWMRDEIGRIDISSIPAHQENISIRVPVRNRLTNKSDLSEDIHQQVEVCRVGQIFDQNIEKSRPELSGADRLQLLDDVNKRIFSRPPSYLDALANTDDGYWIDPRPNTIPYHLNEAKRHLQVGALPAVERELDLAEEMIDGADPVEVGAYWFIKGKLQISLGLHEKSVESFWRAWETDQSAKHLAAWAESEIRRRNFEDPKDDLSDIIQTLNTDEEEVLSVKSRILAANGECEASVSIAESMSGAERYVALAIANLVCGQPEESLGQCAEGERLPDLSHNSRNLLRLVRARARFALVLQSAPPTDEGVVPPGGVAGVDLQLVEDAWSAIQDAVDGLKEEGWGFNFELIVDAWVATASMLGRHHDVLPQLQEAAKVCPHVEAVHRALESLAVQCGDFPVALDANDKLPGSNADSLRRVMLLHAAGRDNDALRLFSSLEDVEEASGPIFAEAAGAAIVSAQKIIQPDLVDRWMDMLKNHGGFEEYVALVEYHLAVESNLLVKEEQVGVLVEKYEELGRPYSIAVTLLEELRIEGSEAASKYLEIAQRVMERAEPHGDMAVRMSMALAIKEDWVGLLEFVQMNALRFGREPRMKAFEALALDQTGRTEEARRLLEEMLDGGIHDSVALNTYAGIMARCGYVEHAIIAADRMLEFARSESRKKDCIRLLFSLVQCLQPPSSRLLALANQMGRLADPSSEVEEGVYLMMFLVASQTQGVTPRPEDVTAFRARSEAFFSRFPNSHILRRVNLPEDSSSEEMLNLLKSITGVTSDSEALAVRLVNQMQRGEMMVPFAWRPKIALKTVFDVVQLWEIAKASGPDARQYHLTMLVDSKWSPPGAASLREKPPLLDFTALLVLFDLGLISKVVAFFGEVAITKRALIQLSELANSFFRSPAAHKCQSIQRALQPHLHAILQPSSVGLVEETGALDPDQQEIVQVLTQRSGEFSLYSDDLAFRVYCAGSDSPIGMCTLDVMAAMEESGLMSRQEVVANVAKLCRWHVGLVVRFEDIKGLLPSELIGASTVRGGMDALESDSDFSAVIDSIWDFRSKFDKNLEHAGAILQRFAKEGELSEVAMTSLFCNWFYKVSLKTDAPRTPDAHLLIISKLTVRASISHPRLSEIAILRVWAVFKGLVEQFYGSRMDEEKEREAIAGLGSECGAVQTSDRTRGLIAHANLAQGLTPGTADESIFSTAYTRTLTRHGLEES